MADRSAPEFSSVCSLLFEGIYNSLRAAVITNLLLIPQQENPTHRLSTAHLKKVMGTALRQMVKLDDMTCKQAVVEVPQCAHLSWVKTVEFEGYEWPLPDQQPL